MKQKKKTKQNKRKGPNRSKSQRKRLKSLHTNDVKSPLPFHMSTLRRHLKSYKCLQGWDKFMGSSPHYLIRVNMCITYKHKNAPCVIISRNTYLYAPGDT